MSYEKNLGGVTKKRFCAALSMTDNRLMMAHWHKAPVSLTLLAGGTEPDR